MRLTRRALLATTAVAIAPSGWAQQTAMPRRVRGQIETASQDTLQVMTRTGAKVTLTISPDVRVTEIAPIDVSAIQPGSFIGTAAVTQPDGTLKALEIQVFPEAMRGVGEGHRPWDLGPQSSMTNGTVGDLKVADGRMLTLTYKGGEQKVYVPPGAPVITYLPGSRDMLRPGANIFALANDGPNESLTATRISVGKDGLVPPM